MQINYLNLAKVWSGAILINNMAQKCNVFCSKTTLVWVQFEIHFPEFAQNRIQMLKMLPLTFAVHIEVINEHLQEFATQVFKDL
jgi:hypothetical protein